MSLNHTLSFMFFKRKKITFCFYFICLFYNIFFFLYVDLGIWPLFIYFFSLKNFFSHFLQDSYVAIEIPNFSVEKAFFFSPPLLSWRICLDIEIWVLKKKTKKNPTFNYVNPLYSCSYVHWWDVCSNSYYSFSLGKIPLFTLDS